MDMRSEYVIGGLLALGTGAVLAWAISDSKQKRRARPVANVRPTMAQRPAGQDDGGFDAAFPVPPGVTDSGVYITSSGDTLARIAQEQYGDALLWPLLYDTNRASIGNNPDALVPNTTLQIPDLMQFVPEQYDDARHRAMLHAQIWQAYTQAGGRGYPQLPAEVLGFA